MHIFPTDYDVFWGVDHWYDGDLWHKWTWNHIRVRLSEVMIGPWRLHELQRYSHSKFKLVWHQFSIVQFPRHHFGKFVHFSSGHWGQYLHSVQFSSFHSVHKLFQPQLGFTWLTFKIFSLKAQTSLASVQYSSVLWAPVVWKLCSVQFGAPGPSASIQLVQFSSQTLLALTQIDLADFQDLIVQSSDWFGISSVQFSSLGTSCLESLFSSGHQGQVPLFSLFSLVHKLFQPWLWCIFLFASEMGIFFWSVHQMTLESTKFMHETEFVPLAQFCLHMIFFIFMDYIINIICAWWNSVLLCPYACL